jgi:hyperosmotically inducible periplasmic protein
MTTKFAILLVPAAALVIAALVPAFAEDSDATASDSMNSAATSMKEAGSNTADALKHTYRGVKTEAADVTTTTKVKSVLHDNKTIGDADIHVTTDGGVVTLRGEVPSRDVANNAEQLAQQTEGVTRVNNELTVMPAGNTPQ